MIPYGMGALLYAPLTNRFSYRRILATSLFLYSIASWLCASSNSLNTILLARMGAGITGASAIPLGLMLIGDFFEREVRGRLVGLFFGCSFFASLAGIILTGIADWRWLFYVPSVLALITAASFVLYPSSFLRKKHEAAVNYLKVFTDERIRNIFIFIFLISFLYHAVHKWFGVYLSEIYNCDKFTISLFFVFMAVGGFAGQQIGGWISDKKGRLLSCYVGIAGLATGALLLYGHYALFVLAIILGLFSMSWTIGHNGISTVLTDFPNADRPIIASLNSSVRFISGGIGFLVSMHFVKHGFNTLFLVAGIFMVALSFMISKLIPK